MPRGTSTTPAGRAAQERNKSQIGSIGFGSPAPMGGAIRPAPPPSPLGTTETLKLDENKRTIYRPNEFISNPDAYKFGQGDAWRDRYRGQENLHTDRANQQYIAQNQARGQQQGILGGAIANQAGMNANANQATNQLRGTQGFIGDLAQGRTQTAGGMGQQSIQQMALNAAAGNGPSAAQAQFGQNLGQSIAAQKALMAGQRGMSGGAAARMGQQAGSDMQMQAVNQAAMLRAQEQQQAMQLAGGITGQARGQDLQAAGLGAQLDLGAQNQLANQAANNMTATGNLASQIRTSDVGLYGGETNAANQAMGAQLGLDQQDLALRQQQEANRYNQWSNYQSMMANQYAGAPVYQPGQANALVPQMIGGAVSGGTQALVDWATK